MTSYSCMNTEELEREYAFVRSEYDRVKAQGLKLNMARGKPAKAQLDAVSGILTVLSEPEECIADNTDVLPTDSNTEG